MGVDDFLRKMGLYHKQRHSAEGPPSKRHSMGTCVSKRPLPPQNYALGSTDSIYNIPYESELQGQLESKKAGKIKGPTKGESISFGFRKKSINTGAIKKCSNTTAEEKTANDNDIGDDNGNTGSLDSLQNNKLAGGSARLKPPKKDVTRSNRFGFRQANIVRPASVGLMPKHADFDGNISDGTNHENTVNNNNNTTTTNGGGSDLVKRRSKSASATSRNSVTFSDTVMVQPVKKTPTRRSAAAAHGGNNNYYHEEQREQGCRIVNSGLHTNNIIYPRPQSSETGKYTLHTTSLPKPQQPIAVNVPTRSPINTKGLKHAMNMSRREFFGLNESTDSGFASHDNDVQWRIRGRNLEMILSGRHKFEVRDLERLTSDEPVVNLALPKLPSVFQTNNYQPAPLGGLVRPIDDCGAHNNSTNVARRESSVTSLDTTESTEEEKLMRDNNSSEKSLKAIAASSQGSKNSSPGSSRHSWCNAGEAMAPKECSSISYSSDESANKCKQSIEEDEDVDISSVTIATGNLITETSLSGGVQIRDNRELEEEAKLNSEFKFAETAANLDDANLLDDETSPTDSLVSSSSDSDEKKKDFAPTKLTLDINEEKDLEDISPELEAMSPLSPGTPTHASNSLSLSDVGRDFLIDDEIADQPELMFDDETKHEPALQSSTDTPTLRDASSLRSMHATPPRRPRVMAPFESPALSRKSRMSRTGSLDTLSPCESIASDDMMMDFELNSSVDSIEKQNRSGSDANTSTRNSVDEMQLLQDLENRGNDMFKDWSLLLRAQKNSSRESLSSQLPSRTRLLTRRSQTSSHNGSDSPRSVESLSRRTKPSPLLQPDDNTELIDKSLKNSILQDVVYFKKQLLRLRRVLQEDDDTNLKTSDTLNPFDMNGTSLNSCTLDENRKIDELSEKLGQPTLSEDQRQELADLRRQVVYLQSQIDDRDRTIRMQQNLITKYETVKENNSNSNSAISTPNDTTTSIETVNSATQTDRLTRPLSMGTMGSDHGLASRSELPVLKITSTTSRSPTSPLQNNNSNGILQQQHQQQQLIQTQPTAAFRKQTQISSVYTQLSSIKPTGLPKNASPCKTVRTTHIGNIPAPPSMRQMLNGSGTRICIANHKSSPELRTVRTTCVGQSTAAPLATKINSFNPITNGHH